MAGKEMGPPQPREPPAGSWQCSCGNVNSPSRAVCNWRGCNLSRPAAGPTVVVDQAGKIVRDATHAPAGASHECDTVTASAERTTPSQARLAPVGGVHHGAAGAGRVVPPLETGVARHFGEPYHWAATGLRPVKQPRRSAYASERVHPYRPAQPPPVPATDELLRELEAIHASTV